MTQCGSDSSDVPAANKENNIPDGITVDSAENSTLANESLQILNNIRSSSRRCGLTNFNATGPLTWNLKLEQASKIHLDDMANRGFFDHTGSDGSSVGDRAERSGFIFQNIAENLADGQRNLQEAFQAWVDSPGHCVNLMNSSHAEFGLATNGRLWVAVFGRSF